MKAIIFLIFISFSLSHKINDAKRAIVIGIDGFNPHCLPDGKIPNFMEFVNKGSWTFARATKEVVSAPGWSQILCSLEDVDTGIVDNDDIPLFWVNKTNTYNVTPVSGSKPLPCVFEQIKKQKPELKTTFIYDWEWFLNFNNTNMGYIDNDVYCKATTTNDYINCTHTYIEDLLKEIKLKTLGFAFFYIGELDDVAFDSSFCSKQYIEYISVIDKLIGRVLSALEETGLDKETVVLITSDHGGDKGKNDHGDFDDQNMFVWWLVKGPNVKQGYKIEANVHQIDTMPTVLNLLGLNNYSDQWRGKPVKEIKLKREKKFLNEVE